MSSAVKQLTRYRGHAVRQEGQVLVKTASASHPSARAFGVVRGEGVTWGQKRCGMSVGVGYDLLNTGRRCWRPTVGECVVDGGD